jgi:hypothetical protein
MTDLINNLIFATFNLWMAYYHAQLFKANKRIRHGLWAALYLGVVGVFCLLFTWWYLPIMILNRAVIFSPALNLFRGFPINYISSSTTSIIDKIELKVFGRNWYKRMAWYTGGWIITSLLKAFL